MQRKRLIPARNVIAAAVAHDDSATSEDTTLTIDNASLNLTIDNQTDPNLDNGETAVTHDISQASDISHTSPSATVDPSAPVDGELLAVADVDGQSKISGKPQKCRRAESRRAAAAKKYDSKESR